jgi:hypothetical protein
MFSEEIFSCHSGYHLAFQQTLFEPLQNSTAIQACYFLVKGEAPEKIYRSSRSDGSARSRQQ